MLVNDAKELQALATHPVDDDVARASDDELSSRSHTAKATNRGGLGEKIDCVENSLRERPGRFRIVSLDVSSDLRKIRNCRPRPPYRHCGGSSSSSVPQLCSQALTFR